MGVRLISIAQIYVAQLWSFKRDMVVSPLFVTLCLMACIQSCMRIAIFSFLLADGTFFFFYKNYTGVILPYSHMIPPI